MGVAERQVQVKMRNEDTADVDIEAMTLYSSGFEGAMEYPKKGTHLSVGRAVDLPVVLTQPVCGSSGLDHVVRVDYRLASGETGTARVTATDDNDAIKDLHSRECFEKDVSQVAQLNLQDKPRLEEQGGKLTATLTVEVTAGAGVAGRLRLLHVGNTTLLQQTDPVTGELLPEGRQLNIDTSQEDVRSFQFTVVPGRCDPHAIAEDKQGTRFPLLVELNEQQGRIPLQSSKALQTSLYDFVRWACGNHH